MSEKYTLVICEKPDAARKVAEAVRDESISEKRLQGISVLTVENRDKTYVICSAVGHLYTVGDPANRRTVYPILDTEWFPSYRVNKDAFRTRNCIEAIQELSKNASDYINCCDFDIEGSVIGYNILRYACGVEGGASRAKFSTLTREEVREAVRKARPGADGRLAEAGRARHVMDFIYGINLSRALSEAFLSTKSGFTSFSVGRVQGPTLAMVVDREIDIQTFVPTPFWNVSANIEKDGKVLRAPYIKEKLDTLAESEEIREACKGKEGTISKMSKSKSGMDPPFPFNLGDLQREAHKVFGFSPSQTLAMAERLYLGALISYPRTSSQKLPASINCKKILQDLKRSPPYSGDVDSLLNGRIVPNQGPKTDPAHPSIYPTGELPKAQLESREGKLFDLIVRRFFAVFGDKAIRESIIAVITISDYD
ncbi:MAG: DNA topoisomerase, partial [Nitrososphaerales archaeon]